MVVAGLLALAAVIMLSGTKPAAAVRCAAATPTTRTRSPAPGSVIPRDMVGVPVRLSQAGVGRLLHPGDHVALTVTRAGQTTAQQLVADAIVLRGTPGDSVDSDTDSMVYLAMTDQQARRVTAVAPEDRIGVTVRPG